MVPNTSFDHIDPLRFEETGTEATLFESGNALDLRQKYATPNRTSIELAHALQLVDEQRQQEIAEKREATPTMYEQMRRVGDWVIYMRKDKLNPIQPITRTEIVQPAVDARIHSLDAQRAKHVTDDHYKFPGAA